ncbi:hypothetical protein T484DRAFT_1607142, partial [Baffinella frigidus]
VTLRDGRHFVGMMRSFDQYGNVMLEDTYERHVVGNVYADERVGLYVIRGENLVLLGELDMEKEQGQTALREVPLETVRAQKEAAKQVPTRNPAVNLNRPYALRKSYPVLNAQHSILNPDL